MPSETQIHASDLEWPFKIFVGPILEQPTLIRIEETGIELKSALWLPKSQLKSRALKSHWAVTFLASLKFWGYLGFKSVHQFLLRLFPQFLLSPPWNKLQEVEETARNWGLGRELGKYQGLLFFASSFLVPFHSRSFLVIPSKIPKRVPKFPWFSSSFTKLASSWMGTEWAACPRFSLSLETIKDLNLSAFRKEKCLGSTLLRICYMLVEFWLGVEFELNCDRSKTSAWFVC